MRRLSFVILLAQLVALNVFSQPSPHGDKLKLKCDGCHINSDFTTIVIKKDSFDHNNTNFTGFPLLGLHQKVSCRKCHVDLIFDHATKECYSCHTDFHQPSVGKDCERCHTPATWIIKSGTHAGLFDVNGKTDCSRCHGFENWKKIKFDHNSSRFKLEGSHKTVKCNECHKEVIDEKGRYVQYKFKDIECPSCHL